MKFKKRKTWKNELRKEQRRRTTKSKVAKSEQAVREDCRLQGVCLVWSAHKIAPIFPAIGIGAIVYCFDKDGSLKRSLLRRGVLIVIRPILNLFAVVETGGQSLLSKNARVLLR